MPKITGFTIVAGENITLAADAFGNNVALRCPACAWPVLLIARANQRGSGESNPGKCHGCDAHYWLELDMPNSRARLHRLPGSSTGNSAAPASRQARKNSKGK